MTTSNSATAPRQRHLVARNIVVGYGERTVLHNLTYDFVPGAITSIIGPNGCGKSTFLRTLGRYLTPQQGAVYLDERPLRDYPSKELARSIGVLPQSPLAPDGITVADLIGRGRTPHQGFFGRWSHTDYEVVTQAMADTGTTELAERAIEELSGGQRQRVWIAMALAQKTDILLLDEPTTYLDLKHQLDILDLLTDLNARAGTTIVMVLHDLNLAARYSHQLVAMADGEIRATGTPAEVITPSTLASVFELDSMVITDPVSGLPAVMPRSRHHNNAKPNQFSDSMEVPHRV